MRAQITSRLILPLPQQTMWTTAKGRASGLAGPTRVGIGIVVEGKESRSQS